MAYVCSVASTKMCLYCRIQNCSLLAQMNDESPQSLFNGSKGQWQDSWGLGYIVQINKMLHLKNVNINEPKIKLNKYHLINIMQESKDILKLHYCALLPKCAQNILWEQCFHNLKHWRKSVCFIMCTSLFLSLFVSALMQ